MVKSIIHKPAEYIQPLNMNGLQGRMLHAPATKRTAEREILLVYGHHALLERWWGLVENLQEYGTVTMPDLPGFGGMDSFAKIHVYPSVDDYADYLAAFIKLRFKRRSITIVGISFGFVVATRMLQKYPDMTKQVNMMVSLVGFMHRDDFLFSTQRRAVYRRLTRIIGMHPLAWIIRYVGLNRFVIQNIYSRLGSGKRRFMEMDPVNFDTLMSFEVRLWQANDVRTHWLTTSEFLGINNCQVPIDLDVWHVASSHDSYFNNHFVEQHMRVVFNNYTQGIMESPTHTPSVLGNKQELSIMLPLVIRRRLKQAP